MLFMYNGYVSLQEFLEIPDIENPTFTIHMTVGYFRGSWSFDEIIKTFSFVTDYKRIIRGTFTSAMSTDAIRTKPYPAKYGHNRYALFDGRFKSVIKSTRINLLDLKNIYLDVKDHI